LKILALSIGTVIKVVDGLTVAFNFLAANPIILIIAAIAAAAYLIYKYWDPICKWIINVWTKIKDFFSGVWQAIKNTFSVAWEWIKTLFIRTNPAYIIYKNWDKIKTYFKDLWTGVKQNFMDFMNWINNIPNRMWQAGKNMIKSLWEGIKSMIMQPINAVKEMVTKIREYLPFSPAKVGPLRDLHRVKIVETIAETMKPAPMLKAMRRVTAGTMMAAGVSGGGSSAANVSGGNVGGHTITYAPVIHMNGSGSKEEFAAMLKKHEKELVKVIEEANRKTQRTRY
jgi:phage-related protein